MLPLWPVDFCRRRKMAGRLRYDWPIAARLSLAAVPPDRRLHASLPIPAARRVIAASKLMPQPYDYFLWHDLPPLTLV